MPILLDELPGDFDDSASFLEPLLLPLASFMEPLLLPLLVPLLPTELSTGCRNSLFDPEELIKPDARFSTLVVLGNAEISYNLKSIY